MDICHNTINHAYFVAHTMCCFLAKEKILISLVVELLIIVLDDTQLISTNVQYGRVTQSQVLILEISVFLCKLLE